MSVKTIDNFNLYTFHLMHMSVVRSEVKEGIIVKGKFLIRSNRNENETKAFYFYRIFKQTAEDSKKLSTKFPWDIKAEDRQPIGDDLYGRMHICLEKIVEQFGQVVPADDAFEFDFNTEGVLGQQLN